MTASNAVFVMNSRASNISSNSSSGRRGHLPSSLSFSSSNQPASPVPSAVPIVSQSKQTISVEEWDRKAPLNDIQVRSVARLAKATEYVPLPLKVCQFKDF